MIIKLKLKRLKERCWLLCKIAIKSSFDWRCNYMNGSIYKADELPLVIQPEVREKCNN